MRSRTRAERAGRRAERLAAWWLRLKGYELLAHRFRSPAGEIDLIVSRGAVVAFVEVKARREQAAALAALLGPQRRRIVRAAEHFLKLRPDLAQGDVRFDLVTCRPWRWPAHLPDAWRP